MTKNREDGGENLLPAVVILEANQSSSLQAKKLEKILEIVWKTTRRG